MFFARLVTERPGWTIVAILGLTLLALTRIVDFGASPPRMRLKFDSSVERLLGVGEEERSLQERARRLFGEDDVLVVALAADDVFTPHVLETLKRLGDRLAGLDGVERVVSLFSALDVHRREGDLVIEPFLTGIPDDPAALARVRERVLANPVYAGNLVSRSGRAAALIIHLEEKAGRALGESGLDGRIQQVVAEERGDLEAWLTGTRHIEVVTVDLLLSDLERIIPLGAMFLLVVAFVAFRTVKGVLIPMFGIVIANLWTLGTMAALGYPLHLVTAVVPALIQTVGITYTMHVVSEYYDQLRRPGATDAAGRALRALAMPLLLTGFTTAAGLCCLMVTPLPAVREFGMFSVIGVIYSALLAATFVPAALSLGEQRVRTHEEDGFDRLAARVARFDLRHRRAILAAGAAVFALSVVGMTRIRVNTDFVSNYPPDHPVRHDFEAFSKYLDGGGGITVALEAHSRDAFKDPANLRELESLQEWLEDQPEVGSTTSLVDYLRVIQAGFLGDVPQATQIPDSKRLVSQLLFFGADQELRRFVDSAYAGASILVRYRTVDSASMTAFLDRLEARLAQLPDHIDGWVTGDTVLLARTVDGISRGQIRSIVLAFLVIYAALSLLFRSPRVGFLAMIPNLLPVAFYFGLLGLVGVSLNPTTAVIACLAIGVAVDDTIHFFARFRGLADSTPDVGEAAASALRIVGRPITATSVALVLGFGAAMTAQLRNQADFGALTAVTLGFAWVVDVLLTPGVAVQARRDGIRRGGRG